MIIVGIDPGKSTGIAVLGHNEITHPTLITHDTPAPENVTGVLESLLSELDHQQVVIVVERFVLREGMYGVDTTPIEVIGRIKEWIKNKSYPVHWQLPTEKELATNAVLRRLGLWLKGTDQRHVMDATRHVVVHLVTNKHIPTIKKGWPSE